MSFGKNVVRFAILLMLVAGVAACSSKKRAPTAPVMTVEQKINVEVNKYEAAEKEGKKQYDAASNAHMGLAVSDDDDDFSALNAAIHSQGLSATVRDDVSAILNAPKKIDDELKKATAAQTALTALKTGATAAQVTKIDTRLAAVGKIVERLTEWKADATRWANAVKDGSDAETAVIATEKANEAAKKVNAALEAPPASTDDVAKLTVDLVDTPGRTVFGYGHTRKSGMEKFTDIFGTSKQAYDNRLVPAISLAGKNIDEDELDSAVIVTGGKTNYKYMGIEGSAICRGGACKDVDGKFSANWYFVPIRGEDDLSEAYFTSTGSDDDKTYTQALYAEYGLWLEENLAGDLVLQRRAGTGRGSIDSATDRDDLLGTEATAEYSGHARGLSYLETGEDDEMQHKSGHFTADVELTAEFGSPTPMLSGTIDEFKGSAVGDDWMVTWTEAALDDNELKFSSAPDAEGQAWNAYPFGEEGSRPMGFYGDFWKHFPNGRAAGVFAAEKE